MESGTGNNYFPQDQELEDEEEERLEEQDNNTVTGGGSERGRSRGRGPRGRSRSRTDTVGGKKRKKRELTSEAWEGFSVLEEGDGDPPVDCRTGVCNACGNHIAADPDRNGTSGLWRHKAACKVKPVKDGQSKLTFKGGVGEGGTLTSWKFSQKESRLALAEMIVLDELPFRFVEKEGFKKFCARVCPDFKIPGRQTIREDCVKLFAEHKDTLRSFFKKKKTWARCLSPLIVGLPSITQISFVLQLILLEVIGKFRKKIIGFRKILGHKADDIGEAVVDVLKDWDLKNILCCTVDNASANDGAVRYVGRSLDLWNTNTLGGKYLHLRCVAHIINLVVSDGLEEVGASVRRVREVVKWVKSSPMRSHEFYKITANLTTGVEKRLCLDVPTRWNSTYMMLEAAEPYKVGIRVFGSVNEALVDELNSKKYKGIPLGLPQEEDWVNVRQMIEYLRIFYDFTLLFSGTTYVTANMFFKEMTSIFEEIANLEKSPSAEMRFIARKMKLKLGKYWLETEELNPRMNKLVYIAAILDPRQKMDYVETCLAQVYGDDRAAVLVAYLKELMHEMFDFYKRKQQASASASTTASASTPASASQTQTSSPISINTNQPKRGRVQRSIVPTRKPSNAPDFSELTIYFSEPQYVDESYGDGANEGTTDTFDILQWWSKDGVKYRVLSEMAKDILAIPISTVASESAFSMGGRVLDQFRSSLNPEMVEALICSSDWLRSSSAFMLDEEDLSEEEQAKVYQNVINSLGHGIDGVQEANASGTGASTSMITPSPVESVVDLTVGRGAIDLD